MKAAYLLHPIEYRTFYHAKDRCENPRNPSYKHYGGRGVRFCFASFDEFWREIGPRPSSKHSLDRKNTEGNYAPGNVRWATLTEQNRNRRKQEGTTSKFKGVHLDRKRERWMASARIAGKKVNLGRFATEHQAAIAYQKAVAA